MVVVWGQRDFSVGIFRIFRQFPVHIQRYASTNSNKIGESGLCSSVIPSFTAAIQNYLNLLSSVPCSATCSRRQTNLCCTSKLRPIEPLA